MSAPGCGETGIKLASINVNGLRSQIINGIPKRRKIFTWLKKLEIDVILLQETHSSFLDEKVWVQEWSGLGVFSHGENNSRGVGILIKPASGATISKVYTDENGRFIVLQLDYNGSCITIGNFYGPNVDNPRAVEEFCTRIDEYENSTIILGGDFNLCLDIRKDRESSAKRISNNDKCKEVLKKFMLEKGLIDIWRELHPNVRKYTCIRKNPASKSRIDFFVTSRDLLLSKCPATADIRDGYLSDHMMITISVSVPSIKMGKSYWKFNNFLLKDEDFVSMMRQKIKDIIDENDSSDLSRVSLFETVLCVLRGYVIEFSSRKKRQSRASIDNLEREISVLQSNGNPNPTLIKELSDQRDTLIREITSRSMFMAKARWHHLAETGSKYFHGFQKRNQPRNVVKALFVGDKHDDQQNITSDTEEMLTEARNFFLDLYRNRHTSEEIEPFTQGLLRLSQQDREVCDFPIDMEELTLAVSSIRNNSSPGPSGYTGEFYKFFWPEIRHLVLSVCHEVFERRKMPINLKRSVTILIPKKEKDTRMIENMRPISLLNTLYKIITKLLANRVSRIIKTIIKDDQTGFIKGRFIGENVRLILDMMDYCTSSDQSALLLSCDVKQAYDCVDWSYMKRVMSVMGFGDTFLRWIDILYDSDQFHPPTSCIQINGKLSKDFQIGRGLRQGCPLSCYIFLICFEPLLERIRQHEAIKGVEINGTEIKISSYADDVTVIMDGHQESFSKCLDVFTDFKEISGLALNKRKTKAFWIGKDAKSKHPICPSLGVQWPRASIELLGITISNDPNVSLTYTNYERKIESMRARLTPWNGRGLTPFGRIHLVKTEMLSQLIYLMTVLPSPEINFVRNLEREIFKFVWGGKRDRVKRATLKAKYKNGGLQVPDFLSQSKSLKISWVKKYLDIENNAKWKSVVKTKFNLNASTTLFHCDCDSKTLKRLLNNIFWEETCEAWTNIKQQQGQCGGELLSQVIWHNRNISLERNPSINKRLLIGKGILRVSDLYSLTERRLMSPNEVAQKYNIHPMNALTLTRSIPGDWIRQLVRDKPNAPEQCEILEALRETAKTAKWAYEKLVQETPQLNTEKCHCKWQAELSPAEPARIEWPTIYQVLHSSTKDVNLKWIQYRIIKRILPTNRLLYIFGLVENDKCKTCPIYSESILHKFWLCPSVRMLWREVKDLVNLPNDFFDRNTFLGVKRDDIDDESRTNTVIMLTNQFIWKCRDNQERLTRTELRRHIRDYISIEKYVARVTGRERQFIGKWGELSEHLQ